MKQYEREMLCGSQVKAIINKTTSPRRHHDKFMSVAVATECALSYRL